MAGAALLACGEAAIDTTWIDPGPDVPVEGRATSSWAGVVAVEDCDAEAESLLWQAADSAWEQLGERGEQLTRCLREHSLTATDGDSPEATVASLQRGSATLRCEDLGPPEIRASAELWQPEDVVVRFNVNFLDEEGVSVTRLTSVLLHELAHGRGYRHGAGKPEFFDESAEPPIARTVHWYDRSVTQQLSRCSAAMSAGQHGLAMTTSGDYAYGRANVPRGNYAARSELSRATWLAVLGTGGSRTATPPESSPRASSTSECGPDAFAVGLFGRRGAFVDRLGLRCADRETRRVDDAAGVGSTGGTPFVRDCPAGTLLVGVRGSADVGLHHLAPACQPLEELSVASDRKRSVIGGAGDGRRGRRADRFCPFGMAVRRLMVGETPFRQRTVVSGVRLECASLDAPVTGDVHWLPTRGTTSEGARVYEEPCPAGSVVVTLEGRSGAHVDRLEGLCAEVERSSGRGLSHDPLVAATLSLEGHGGFGGQYSSEYAETSCPRDQALVGVRIAAEDQVQNLAAVCAPLDAWSRADERGAPALLTTQGWMGTGEVEVVHDDVCPAQSFVGGWRVGVGLSEGEGGNDVRVQTLAIQCVDPS